MAKRARRTHRYPDEYRNAALARLVNERPIEIAKSLDISPTMLRRWKLDRDNPRQKKLRYFPDEFKRAAVARVIAGESVSEVARELGIVNSILSQWNKKKEFRGRLPTNARPAPPPAPRRGGKKKSYYVKVADRMGTLQASNSGSNGSEGMHRRVHACVGLLKGIRGKCDNSDPVHLTALLVLATLEGKM